MKKAIIELMVTGGMLTPEQGEHIINAKPERIVNSHLDTYTSAQLAIYFAMGELEKVGADVELTNTLLDLQTALNRLTGYLIKEQDSVLI